MKFLARILFFLAAILAVSRADENVDITAFIAAPDFEMLKLSPSGKRVAIPTINENHQFLAMLEPLTMKTSPLCNLAGFSLLNYWWKGEDLLVLFAQGKDSRYRFLLLDANTGKIAPQRQMNEKAQQLIDVLPGDPDNILITAWRMSRVDLVKLNLRTGKTEVVCENPGGEATWMVDAQSNPVAAIGTEFKKSYLYWRTNPAAKWQRHELGPETDPKWMPVYVHPDGKRLLAWKFSPERTAQIIAVDPQTLSEELVFQSPVCDDYGIDSWGDNDRRARAVTYEKDGYPAFHFLDTESAELCAMVDRSLPGRVNNIYSTSTDANTLLIFSWSDTNLGEYYYLDRAARKLVMLGSRYPGLAKQRLSPSKEFQFTSRDGLRLSGRIFLPVNTQHKPPLVLMVTGDIGARRASYSADNNAQLFAAKGYATVEINYRGTRGFGRGFEAAGDLQLGSGMPADLEDGVRYLIKQGWVDENKIVLFGSDDAGVVGFQTLIRTNLFCAWVNLNTKMNAHDIPTEQVMRSEREALKRLTKLGGKLKLVDYLEPLSPSKHLSEVKVPSFHYYSRSPGDNQLIHDGGVAQRYFAKATTPSVFIRGLGYRVPSDYWWDQAERTRVQRREAYAGLFKFLDQYVPATVPSK